MELDVCKQADKVGGSQVLLRDSPNRCVRWRDLSV